jgi:membrane protein DedA with SNARE-associated domain
VYDVVGGVVWAGGVALLGYAAGRSYQQVADVVGRAGAIGAGAATIAALCWWWRARIREDR